MMSLTTIIISLTLWGQIYNDWTREMLAEFKVNTIQMPVGRDSAELREVIVTDTALRSILVTNNAEMVIKAFPKFDPKDTVYIAPDGSAIRLADFSKIFKLRFKTKEDATNALEAIKQNHAVIYAEPEQIGHFDFTVPDDSFPQQWNLHNTGQPPNAKEDADIDMPEAWDITTGTIADNVGIVDQGVYRDQEEFQTRVRGDVAIYGNHGTYCAGVAAAKGNNKVGIAGINWYADIISGSVDPQVPVPENFAAATTRAINYGASNLNCSWGVPEYSVTLRKAFSNAYKVDAVVVATMGNTGNIYYQYPAAFKYGIIAVGSTTNQDLWADYSTRGPHIDVAAPGGKFDPCDPREKIITTYPSVDRYHRFSGTSAAAPHVTGLSSLLRGYSGNILNAHDIERFIIYSADDKDVPGWDDKTGWGRINAHRALRFLRRDLGWRFYQLEASGKSYERLIGTKAITFYDVVGLTPGTYECDVWEVYRNVTYPSFVFAPYAWGRGSHYRMRGFSDENPNFGMGWCDFVSIGNGQGTLKTFVYYLREPRRWIPCEMKDVRYTYTILGSEWVVPPSKPTNLRGKVTHGAEWIVVSWDPSIPGTFPFSHYQVYRKEKTDREPTTTFIDKWVLTYYTFRPIEVGYLVRGVDDRGVWGEWSDQWSIRVDVIPKAAGPGNQNGEKICLDSQDSVHLVFPSLKDDSICYLSGKDTLYNLQPTNIGQGMFPAIALNMAEDPLVVWTSDGAAARLYTAWRQNGI